MEVGEAIPPRLVRHSVATLSARMNFHRTWLSVCAVRVDRWMMINPATMLTFSRGPLISGHSERRLKINGKECHHPARSVRASPRCNDGTIATSREYGDHNITGLEGLAVYDLKYGS